MSFIRSQIKHAIVQLPVMDMIILDVSIVPDESVDWSSDDEEYEGDNEDGDMHIRMVDYDHNSDPDMDYDPRVG